MAVRRSSRWLAPLALLGAVAAILLTVSSVHKSSSSNDAASGASSVSTSSSSTSTTSTTSTTSSKHARHYVVKPGDSLSAIAAATGVSLDTIEQLNPTVDAQSLHAGQKIKIGQ